MVPWSGALAPAAGPALLTSVAGEQAHQAGQSVLPMVVVGVVLVATFVAIGFELLHKSVAALLGAVAAVVAALLLGVYEADPPYSAVHEFVAHDMGVLGVIVGTSMLVDIAGASGLFHFLAIRLVKLTGGDPRRLFAAVMAATIAFVTFLTIAPGVLIMTSLVLVITRELDDDPVPYVVAVAIGANSGALMTFASGIPTLMIGTSADIPYVHFLVVSTPLALLSGLLAFLVIRRSYRARLRGAGDPAERRARVAAFDEWALVTDRAVFFRSAAILALTIVGFAFAQELGVGLDFVAFAGATAALLFAGSSPEETIRKVKWPIIVFFIGLFVLVGTVRQTGLLDVLARQIATLSGGEMLPALALMVPFVFVSAAVVDNIPVAATMIPIVRNLVAGGMQAEPLWWALIAACNLGGNPTPIGSIGAVIALHALERERGLRVGWGEYLKVGGLVALLQIPLVIGYIELYRWLDLFPQLPAGGAG